MKVALVGCGKSKLTHAALARDLYTGQLFRAARDYVESQGWPWFILSARYGLVSPDDFLEPYNVTLNGKTQEELEAWGRLVFRDIYLTVLPSYEIVFLAGRSYRLGLMDDLTRAYKVSVPLAHLGIGQQVAWLKRHTATQLPLFVTQ